MSEQPKVGYSYRRRSLRYAQSRQVGDHISQSDDWLLTARPQTKLKFAATAVDQRQASLPRNTQWKSRTSIARLKTELIGERLEHVRTTLLGRTVKPQGIHVKEM